MEENMSKMHHYFREFEKIKKQNNCPHKIQRMYYLGIKL